MGFGVLKINSTDFNNSEEFYSPKFREVLGYDGEHDFPNSPKSWQSAIEPKDLKIALINYEAHVNSKGNKRYIQVVTYNKKGGGQVELVCHGKIVAWEGEKPLVMIGVHMPV